MTNSANSSKDTNQSKSPNRLVSFGEFVVLMAYMMSLTALTIDTILPALGIIGKELGTTDPNHNQLIISFFFLGLAIGQFVYGPVSDSIGRKRPVYWGLSLFLLGSFLSLFAGSLFTMLSSRFIQGLGLASTRTLSTAMIRDEYKGDAMARVMSFVMMTFILVPTLAPALGQGILMIAHWRFIFGVILLMGFILLIWFSLRMHETLEEKNRNEFSIKQMLRSVLEIFTNRYALTYTIVSGLMSGAFISFLNSSQQIFQDLHNITDSFPLYFAFLAISVGVASFLNSQLVLKYGTVRMVKFCIINLVAISALSWIILYNMEVKIPLWGTMTYLIITLFWIGFLFSNLNSLAMEPLGHIAGTGSAIVGAVSTLLGVAIGTAISLQYDGSLVPLAMGFTLFGAISLAMIFWVEHSKRNLNAGA